jgi:Tol biopolymer transport system component
LTIPGEVYKAKDTRLDRTVAIKVLPSHLSGDAERRQRFEREARTVSSLNHPHICTLHDIGEHEGIDYLVMEYLEGETLADRLKKGALPLDQALKYGIEIADALDKAHRQGVVHRDLKPGNIMLTKSGAKLLDFGLAKLKASAPGQAESVLSALPTEEKPLTEKGSILGTFQYMAPEQLEGKDADARTDIFTFGAVLYEMVTGKRAFEGKSQASLIGAIMEHNPPAMSTLQSMSPPALDHVVKTCLAKDPDRRWQSAGDVERQLTWIVESGTEAGLPVVARPKSHVHLAWGLALLLVVVVAVVAVWNLKPPPPQPVTRLPLPLPPGDRFTIMGRHLLALSPDGMHLVYVANQQLYLRAMDQMEAIPISGTEGGGSPFFSPDGQWIGFWSEGQLSKVSVSGGAPMTLCEAGNPFGASWGGGDTIVFGQGREGILQVSAAGGKPEVLVPASSIEGIAQGPQILPDGKSLLFTLGDGGDWNDAQIVVQSLATGERRVLIEGGTDARYVPTGHLVYALRRSILAVPFDADRLEVTGGPVSLVDGVATGYGALTGAAHFSVSDTGSMVYFDDFETGIARTLVWVDREGREEPLSAGARAYTYPRISPDGTREALDIRDQEHDIWIWDFAREILTRLTSDAGRDRIPIWTPEGRLVLFTSGRYGGRDIFGKAADGTGQAEQIIDSPNSAAPSSISPDGKLLVILADYIESGPNLRVLSLEGERSPKALLVTEFSELNGEVSPDGRWLAYQSNESGQFEIYVRPFPNVHEGRWPISTGGGTRPLWAPGGRELFYLSPGGRLMVVPVQTASSFAAGSAEILFDEPYFVGGVGILGRTYDISPDGRRFLMIKESEEATSASLSMTVVLNWFEELKARVPTEN